MQHIQAAIATGETWEGFCRYAAASQETCHQVFERTPRSDGAAFQNHRIHLRSQIYIEVKTMKRYFAILMLLACLPWLLAAEILYVVNSQSRTLSRIDLNQNSVNNSFALLGNVPNKLAVSKDYLWLVASGDNAIQKISPATGQILANYLVEVAANPWDAIYQENYLYISGLISGKVYKMDTRTGQVLASLQVGIAPEALAIMGDKLYVTNAGNYVENYAGSSLSVIDLPSFSLLKNMTLPANPQYLTLHGDKLHISCTGNWTEVLGKIVVLDTANDEIIHTLDLGGSPGNIQINSAGIAYVADAGGYSLFRYDANTMELLNPADNPLNFAAGDLLAADNYLALLNPNWGSNGSVQVVDWELSALQSFTVGMMPTDIKRELSPTSVADAIQIPAARLIQLYPSPLRVGQSLNLKSLSLQEGMLRLYNLRGEKVQEEWILPGAEKSLKIKQKSGLYFYRFESGGKSSAGKITVM